MKKLFILLLFPFMGFAQTGGYLLSNSNGTFSIGTSASTAPLTVANFTGSFVAPQAGTMVHVVSDNAVNGRISHDTYNNVSFTGSIIQGRRARGTAASPTPPILDDIIMSMGGDGWGESFTGSSVGSFNIRSAGTFTNTSKPTYLSGTTTPTGSTAQLERFKVSSTGAWKFNAYGTGAITGTPTYSLQVDASGNIIEGGLGGGASWGGITGTLSNQTDLQNALNGKQATGNYATGGGTATGTNTGDNATNTQYSGLATSKENTITAGTTGQYWRGDKTFQTLDKTAVGLANVDNTSDANKPVSTATQTALNAKQNTLTLTTTGSGAATLVGATLNIPTPAGGSGYTTVVLPSDVTNSTVTIADVTGLSFPVTSGITYKFKFYIIYTAAVATTGSRWSINGPATTLLNYTSMYTLSATSQTTNFQAAYNVPAAANASSLTVGNCAIIEGVITPSANGTVIARFASEIAASAIVAKAKSYVEYQAQ